MKKIIMLFMVVLMLSTLSINANADTSAIIIEPAVDISTGVVSVSGMLDKPLADVTVQVFRDKTMLEIDTTAEAESLVAYVTEVVTDKDGKFSFSFKYTSVADKETLHGYLGYGVPMQQKYFEIKFTKSSYYETLIGNLNSAANAESFADFYSYCNNNKEELCSDLGLANSIDFTKATELFYADVKETNLLPADSEKNQKRFMNCIVTQAFNESKLSSINVVADELDLDETLLKNLKKVSAVENADPYFVQLMSGKNIISSSGFVNRLKTAMIITAVRYPNGFANLKELCEEYASFIGLTKTYSDSAYKAVAGSIINSLKELKDKLDAASDGTAGGSGGAGGGASGGGSSGGGASGGGAGGGKGTSFAVQGYTENETAKEVYMPFEDLSSSNWAYEAVSVLADKRIISGKEETRFYPNDAVTREEFARMIIGAMGIELNYTNNDKFIDVENNSWYMPYVYTAYSNGVCRGVSENKFGVGERIIRQDAAVMIYNALKKVSVSGTSVEFSDGDSISDYAKEAVGDLASMGVINGKGDNNFEPLSSLTRAEAAQIIYKAFFCI